MGITEDRDDILTDNALQSEIELVGDLVVAATSSDGPMRQDEVDLVLGVSPRVIPAKEATPTVGEPAVRADS